MTDFRQVRQVIQAHDTQDGDGVKIRRVHGFDNPTFSPFLMIDELKSDDEKDYVGGFPPHPHRGIETLTYMLEGHFQHKDHMGNVGELRSGGAQWMAAGRGVIHSEMPIMQQGQLHGFQIWINQPAKNKMIPAQYHDYQPETIVEHQSKTSGLMRMIAGALVVNEQSLTGPLTNTGVTLAVADWRAEAQQKTSIRTEASNNAMIYVYKGKLDIAGKAVRQGELALLSLGEKIKLLANEDAGALVFSGTPIEEPVVHYGPFVMNSMQEIEQAIHDYNTGVFETY